MRELFTIAIFKIKADIRMNKTALNSQKEKHFMLSLRRATPALLPITVSISQFLSTISLRRATVPWPTVSPPTPNFYPRSPCGERLDLSGLDTVCRAISIHALLAESDARNSPHRPRKSHFYPRSPCGERHTGQPVRGLPSYFYPRSPCGERQIATASARLISLFLSTLSLRRATAAAPWMPARQRHFYPRSPCGERPGSLAEVAKYATISIHALLAESDSLSDCTL